MIIEYKKETDIVLYIKSKVNCVKFNNKGFLIKIGLKEVVYPDIYIHTGSVNSYAKKMIENSKITIVNSTILKDELTLKLNIKNDSIRVILPINDLQKYKKSDVKKPFYEKYDIKKDDKIIYFTAKDFKRNGFDSFCDIITKIESTNYKVVVTCNIDKEMVYAKKILEKYNLTKSTILIEDEIFDVADIYIQPTMNKNFSLNVVKAITNKCVVFLPDTNNAIEILDVFAIMDDTNDSNTAYKIDMLLRVDDEFKKVRKENYKIGKKLNTQYMNKKVDLIFEELDLNKDK